MEFDRWAAKLDARACMILSGASPIWVSLVYGILVLAVPAAAVALCLTGPVLTGRYAPALPWLLLFLGVVIVLYRVLASVGYVRYGMRLARGWDTGAGNLLDGFGMAWLVLRTWLLLAVRLLLWSALGVLPVILLWFPVRLVGRELVTELYALSAYLFLVFYLGRTVLRYPLTFFFLMDHPQEGARAAIRSSTAQMRGHKWDFLELQVSFLGWWLVSLVTLGLAGLWVRPYWMAACVNFYDCVTGRRATGEMTGRFAEIAAPNEEEIPHEI